MAAYYNEIDPYAVQWLRNLIAAGHIAPGDVDDRSIKDVRTDDLKGYSQCHFFAGIGVWSYALRLAGWPDNRPVWTGSCPCQPFSAAGKQQGTSDERHLWPAWFSLIRQCKPAVVFGEQVEAAIRHGWLDLVQADLEGIGYAVAAAGIPAAGFGAPHIRQRLWFVADSAAGSVADTRDSRRQFIAHEPRSDGAGVGAPEPRVKSGDDGADSGRLDNNNKGLEGHWRRYQAEGGHGQGSVRSTAQAGESGGVANADLSITQQFAGGGARPGETIGAGAYGQLDRRGELAEEQSAARPTNGHWRNADWLFCRDGKWRPVEPGTFPLAHGAAARVGRLRAYGNAIVPQVAQAFIESYLGCEP